MALLKPNTIINDNLILQGPIIDGNGSKGSNGQYLTSNGSSSAPTWQDFPSTTNTSGETTECYKVNLLETTLTTSTTGGVLTSWLNTTTDNQTSFTLGSGTVTTNHIQVATAGRYLVGFNLDINHSTSTNTLRTIYSFEVTVGGTKTGTEVRHTYMRGNSNQDNHLDCSANSSIVLDLNANDQVAVWARRASGLSSSDFTLTTNSTFFVLKLN
jgi:hypothetical protein|tara:strand:- start:255 stop:893 length:639 start_codon:yes stop_codon:yes gene_type:complete